MKTFFFFWSSPNFGGKIGLYFTISENQKKILRNLGAQRNLGTRHRPSYSLKNFLSEALLELITGGQSRQPPLSDFLKSNYFWRHFDLILHVSKSRLKEVCLNFYKFYASWNNLLGESSQLKKISGKVKNCITVRYVQNLDKAYFKNLPHRLNVT